MKTIIFFALLFLAASCIKKSEFLYQTTDYVNISHIVIPDTINLSETALISARAEAYSSCWSNLHFVLTKNTDFTYSLQALGFFYSTGSCAEKSVVEDTVFHIQPAATGRYLFYITQIPYDVIIDTLVVK